MRRRFWAVALCAGCGHLGYEPTPTRDAGPDGGRDGGFDGGGSDAGRFGEPELIDELSFRGALDDDPSMTGDLTEIYFKSDRGGGGDFDIWMASRASPGDSFGALHEVAELSSPAFDATPEVSLDGLTMHLSSNREGSQGFDVYLSTRAARDAPWSTPERVPELCTNGDEFSAVTEGAGVRVILTRAVSGQSLDLFEATRPSAVDPWGPVAALTILSTPEWDADAHLSPDGLLLIYASDRPGGAGQRDLWASTRESPDGDLSPPVDLPEIATPSHDEDPWLSGDGRTLVFSSDRDGDQELWIARR